MSLKDSIKDLLPDAPNAEVCDGLSVLVAQLGARQHYEIPRILHDNNALAGLYTDIWMPTPRVLKPFIHRLGGTSAVRLSDRYAALPSNLVHSSLFSGLYWYYRLRRSSHCRDELYRLYAVQGAAFAKWVAKGMRHKQFTTFFGFSSTSLEAMNEARDMERLAVLDEIAPTHLEDEIIAAEQQRYPGWERHFSPTPDAFLRRIESEWAVANRILVNSAWTRDALVRRGVASEKIRIVPISIRPSSPASIKRRGPAEPLKVLWLGTLNLRKGIPYALEAARRLEGSLVQFTFAGSVAIDLDKRPLPKNAQFLGHIPRSLTKELWNEHHVFLLPTLSDGFAITQVEAMSNGLPVIATPNCGEVVEPGVSGIVVRPRSADCIVDALQSFVDGRNDLEQFSAGAISRARQFSFPHNWLLLREVLSK